MSNIIMILAFIIASAITSVPAFANTVCDIDKPGYTSPGNPFPCLNGGNCTWWAFKRATETWYAGDSSKLPFRGNAETWIAVAKNAGFPISSKAAPDTVGIDPNVYISEVVCTKKDKNGKCLAQKVVKTRTGHAVWVMSVSGSKVVVSEMIWGKPGRQIATYPASRFTYISKK